jgi:TP901 family phage tail tape measure protein
MAERIDIIVKLRDAASKSVQGINKSMLGLGKTVKATGKAFTGFRTQLLGIGALFAGGAFLGNVLQTFAKFDDTMRQVGAVTGATREQLKAMTDVAKEMGATTRFSASEAADGLRLLGMAGFEAEDAMKALPGVLNLAAAGSLDLGSAADIATNVLAGFGLEVEQLGQVNDVLVKTFTSSNTTLVELGEAFKLVGPIAKGVGADFEDLVGSIGQLGNAGLKGTLAGTALRGAINALFNPTNQEAKLMKELAARIGQTSLEIKNADGDFVGFARVIEQLEAAGLKGEEALQLFGQRAGPGMAALLQVGSEGLKEYVASLKDADGVSQRIAEDMESGIGGALRELSASFEAVKIILGETFGEDIIRLVQQFRDWLLDLIDVIKELRDDGTLRQWAEGIQAVFNIVVGTLQGMYRIVLDITRLVAYAYGIITRNQEMAAAALADLGKEWREHRDDINKTEQQYYKIDKATGNVVDGTQKMVDTIKAMKGPIGRAKKEVDDFEKQLVKMAKEIVSPEVAARASLQELKATLALQSVILDQQYEKDLKTVDEYYNEKIAIARKASEAEIKILEDASSQQENADKRRQIDAQIFAKKKQLDVQIAGLNQKRFQEEKRLGDDRVKEAERVEQLKVKAQQAIANQAARAAIDEPGLTGQFQKEEADLQARQQKEREIAEESIRAQEELLRQRGLNEFQIKEELAAQEVALNQFKLDQIAEQEKLHTDQQFRALNARFENAKTIAQGTASLFQNLYEITGKQTKEFFYLSKAAAIAEATINIAQGVTKAIAQGGIFGVIQGATVAAAGAVQIAKITSQGLAEGGEVLGKSPSTTADNIPIRATAGEFMQPVSAVQHYGKGVMEAIRQKAVPREILKGFGVGPIRYGRKGFQSGGAVTPSSGMGMNEGGGSGEKQTNIINVLDPTVFDQYTTSTPGQQNIMNVLSENKFQLKQLVFDNQD